MRKLRYSRAICLVIILLLAFSTTSYAYSNDEEAELIRVTPGWDTPADIDLGVHYKVEYNDEDNYENAYFKFTVPEGGYLEYSWLYAYSIFDRFYDDEMQLFTGRAEGGKTYYIEALTTENDLCVDFIPDPEGSSFDDAVPLEVNEKRFGQICCGDYASRKNLRDDDYFSFTPDADGYYNVKVNYLKTISQGEGDYKLVDEFNKSYKIDSTGNVFLHKDKTYYLVLDGFFFDNAEPKYWVRISNQPVEKIKLDNTKLTLNNNATKRLRYIVYPKDATCTDVNFRSEDASLASVSSNGVVRGKAAGKTTIICEARDGYGASAKCIVIVKPKKPVIISTSKVAKVKTKVTWKAVENATGYDVYRATSKTGKYSKVKTVKGTTYTSGKLKKNKYYYYKVKAYIIIDGQKYYSDYSTYKSIKTC